MNCETCGHYSLLQMVRSGQPYGYAGDIPCFRCVRFQMLKDEHTQNYPKVYESPNTGDPR